MEMRQWQEHWWHLPGLLCVLLVCSLEATLWDLCFITNNVSAWFLLISLVSRKSFPLRGRSPLPCHLPVVSSLLWLITAAVCCQGRVCIPGGGAHAVRRGEEAELRIKWKQVLAAQWQPCSPACIPCVQQGPHPCGHPPIFSILFFSPPQLGVSSVSFHHSKSLLSRFADLATA